MMGCLYSFGETRPIRHGLAEPIKRMAYTDINGEDRLVQATFAEHLEKVLGWDSVYAWNHETFGPDGTLGRASERDVVLVRDLRAALVRLNPALPEAAIGEAVAKLTHHDYSRSLLQHNHAFHHHAFLIVRNGDNARYGSITSAWEHFGEWKRLDERDKGSVAAEVLLNGLLAKDRLQFVLHGLLRREGAAHRAGQLHLCADDRPRRPDQTHL